MRDSPLESSRVSSIVRQCESRLKMSLSLSEIRRTATGDLNAGKTVCDPSRRGRIYCDQSQGEGPPQWTENYRKIRGDFQSSAGGICDRSLREGEIVRLLLFPHARSVHGGCWRLRSGWGVRG